MSVSASVELTQKNMTPSTTALLVILDVVVTIVLVAVAYNIGQNNAPAQPLSDTATIACPFGSEFSLSRGTDATVTVWCMAQQ